MHVIICGNAIKRTRHIIMAAKKGQIPLKIVSRGISPATPLMIYTFIPTGGVITPIATTRTITTPNQMGS